MKNDKFKVVRILDEYRIVINAGLNQGITGNDYFTIEGVVDNISDPDTGELLGSITGTKAKVRPVEIFEKMSICQSIEEISYVSNLLKSLEAVAPSPQKLNVDKTQISNPDFYEEIQLGDEAILIKRPVLNVPVKTENRTE